ncbi:MAG: ribose-phosphate pyrophosphokinase [Myxococcota bacterium]
MDVIALPLPGNEPFAARLGLPVRVVDVHAFPDGESRVRVDGDLAGEEVAVVCTLDRPDPKIVPLTLAACAARDRGARRVVLVAPYLCYMRQDRAFQPGEAVAARVVAELLAGSFDALVTVDPHLHRISSLAEVWAIPSRVAHAAPAISAWVRANVRRPLVIGPDEESAQWAEAVARGAGAPSTVLRKTRRGDRDVEVTVPDLAPWPGRVPVLVDDIVSTARTMAAAAEHLRAAGSAPPVCAVVHALFAPGAEEALGAAGVARVVSCDTVVHRTNGIGVAPLVAEALARV